MGPVAVVAMLIEQSFDMFRSLAGTWLVFALIFVSTWLIGVLVNIQALMPGMVEDPEPESSPRAR